MKIIKQLKNTGQTKFSCEILPPSKGMSIQVLYDYLEPFVNHRPAFINVTYHRAEQIYKKLKDGTYERVEIRKRPGTVGICAAIMNKFGIDAVPHLICGGFSKEETENALLDLNYLGIDNVFALRGDAASNEKNFMPHPNGHKYASDLVKQIESLNNGQYLQTDIVDGVNTNFCVGVAGYPEKHFEAPNIDTDLFYLKQKVELGADYITTQMFFDNKHFFRFKKKCLEHNINAPIIPGLKPISSKKQLSIIPRTFNVEIPIELSSEILKAKNDSIVEEIGEQWLLYQCQELIKENVPLIHFYTQGKSTSILKVIEKLF